MPTPTGTLGPTVNPRCQVLLGPGAMQKTRGGDSRWAPEPRGGPQALTLAEPSGPVADPGQPLLLGLTADPGR